MILFKKILKIIIVCILLFILFVASFNRFYISFQQKYYNNKLLQNKSQYTIMCLGESTTAGQYPIQLQQILDKKYPNKFSVIDCGIQGTVLEAILDLLDDNINEYKPDIVICMMGGNFFIDFDYQNSIHSQNKFRILKNFIKMFIVFKNNIKSLFCDNLVFADTQNQNDILTLAIELHHQNKIDESNTLLKQVLETAEKDSVSYSLAYTYLFFNYGYFMKEEKYKTFAYEMSLNAIKWNYRDKNSFYLFAVLYLSDKIKFSNQKLLREKLTSELTTVISSLLNEKDFVPNIDIYNIIEPYLTVPERTMLLDKIISLKKENYPLIAMQYLKQKDYQKAQEYFDKAEEIRLKFPNLKTYDLYKRIVKKLIDNNIKVICMQYPIRSIVSLQEQLKNEPYYDKITFISNEKLFKDALMKKNFNDIFKDQCSGDFGHCTDLGNTMIAKNVVDILEKILNLKQN